MSSFISFILRTARYVYFLAIYNCRNVLLLVVMKLGHFITVTIQMTGDEEQGENEGLEEDWF